MGVNSSKLSKIVQNGQGGLIWTNVFQKGPKWSKMVKYGPK